MKKEPLAYAVYNKQGEILTMANNFCEAYLWLRNHLQPTSNPFGFGYRIKEIFTKHYI